MADPEKRDRPLVLVVDDEPDIRDLVTIRLQQDGYDVIAAEDGATAIEMVRLEHPDAAVIDVRMPGLDGYEVTRQIRADPALVDTPILLLSASVREEEVRRGYDAGADSYIRKPFVPAELREAVRALLERAASKGGGDRSEP